MLSATSFASVAPSLIHLPAAEQCLVADQSCSQIQALVAGVQRKLLDGAQDGHPLDWISEGLRQQREAVQPIRTLHLIAHGRPGAFRIGESWIDAEALKAHAADLAHWDLETIALWSCHVGADDDFVALLAELTGAQVLASADWLGRDEEGNEQLQLGALSLVDFTDAASWPKSFRLASMAFPESVPDGLDPEGVRIALGAGKHWGATDQTRYDAWATQHLSTRAAAKSNLSITPANGSGICAEDELLFKATGKDNGYVSITLALDAGALPAGSQVWFSSTGEEGSWDPDFESGDLTQLSASGEGYVKVKLPDNTEIGSTLKAEIEQWDIQLDPEAGNPIIPLNYNQLVLDGAEQLSGTQDKKAHEEWRNPVRENTFNGSGQYRYRDIFPALKEGLGLELIADVGFDFSGVRRFIFDDPKHKQGAKKERFQPLMQEGSNSDSVIGDAKANFTWSFWLSNGNQSEAQWRQVDLQGFYVNPIDVDSHQSSSFGGDLSGEYIQLLDAPNGLVVTRPKGEGGAGEKGPDDRSGQSNLLRDRGNGKYLGSRKWNAYNGDKASADTNLSNVPAASLVFDYSEPVSGLEMRYGIDGVINPNETDGYGYYGTSRFFSASFGNSITSGGGFNPIFESEKADGSIILEDCFGFYIKATAACIEEEESSSAASVTAQSDDLFNEASFTFDVIGGNEGSQKKESLEGEYVYEITVDGERVGTKYANYSLRFEDEFGNLLEDDEVLFESKKYGDGSGILTVKEGVEDFRVVFDVIPRSPGDQLVGDESVTLELTHKETGKNDEATASLEDELGCDPVGSNPAFTITATAACENEETELLTDASFTFSVKGALAPGSREPESLKGDYTYVLAVNGERVGTKYAGYDYRIEGRNGEDLSGRIVSVDEGHVGDGVGALWVKRDISEFRIVFDVDALAEGDELTGDESVTLSLERNEVVNSYAFATASLADELGCDPLPNEREIFLEPFAACVKDGVLSNSTAEFIFKGEFKPATTEARSVEYIIDPSSGLLDGDYSFNLQLSDGISIKEGGSEGVLKVDEGVSDFSIEITASAADTLTGDESITLTLIDDGEVVTETASLAELDCAPEPEEQGKTDVELYLLMDNSTSMLQPDPSTTGANRRDRLESQDRVSLYAYQQALEKAGYGFSRKGESGVLSEAEFKDAVINNSAADLSNLLNGFEVIVDPDQEGAAEDLTVHLITYGYAVDYGSVKITADDLSAGTRAAQAIVGVLTPDQIYGNSIEGNSLWSDRKLPTPTSNDIFRGDGRPTSNLYSGTEMMGALEGLEHLLSAQAERSGSDPITTYISMATDGRPERRAWWDTRKGPGSDSLTGQAVRLPDALGGDAISTSGLVYDADGNHQFLRNNSGRREWRQVQRKLNNTLDDIAAQAVNAKDQLQVSVVGMGDGTDADFPAIYADLFGERTFINSKGGWDYEYFTSYALPDFIG